MGAAERRAASEAVAEGNGLAVADLPNFRRHMHPETGAGPHTSWSECAWSWCTWAGCTDEGRIAAAEAAASEAR